MNPLRMLLAATLGLTLLAYNPRPDLEGGHYLKAMAEAEAQLKANPSDALAWAAKSQALTSFQRFDEALAAAEKALSLNPGLADALQARGLARAGAAIQDRSFSSLRKIGGALDDLNAAVKADPTEVTAWYTLGRAYQQLPGILGGSTRKALECAESLRRVNGPKGDLLQGTILSLDERWNEAEPYFKRALTASPADSDVIAAYLDALGSRETRKTLGELEQKKRLYAEAHRLLTATLGSTRAVEAVSQALLDADQVEEAWILAMDKLGEADAPSLLRIQLGKIAAKAGVHQEEGLAMLEQAIQEPLEGGEGGYAAAYWREAQILKDMGRRAAARTALSMALRADPRHRGALQLMEELKE